MDIRRYGDDEVREIFRRATTGEAGQQAMPVDSDGFTLAELQRIGAEAGIDPQRVVQAASSLDALARHSEVRRSMGLPIGVSRVVELPRAPSDREWELLVTEFRTVFQARGVMNTAGDMREWANGNLHIAVEPTARGHQLRLSTLKSDAQVFNMISVLFAAMAVIMGATVAASGKLEKAFPMVMMFGGLAMASFAANVFRVPRWARTRDRQLTQLAERVVTMLTDG